MMKDYRKKVPDDSDDGKLSQEDQQLVEMLRSGLDALDKTVSVSEPDPAAFARQMDMNRSLIHRKFIRDLLIFLVAALSLLGAMGLALFRLPVLFVILYAAGLAFPMLLVRKEHERVREE